MSDLTGHSSVFDWRSRPRVVNTSKVDARPQQPSDGPGVQWFRDRPFCSTCDEPLGPIASEIRPHRVPRCPVCPPPRGVA